MKKLLILLINLLLIASCTPNIQSKDVNNESLIQQNTELNKEDGKLNYRKQIYTDTFEEPDEDQHIEDELIRESFNEDESKETFPQVTYEPNSQPTNENEHSIHPETLELEQHSLPIADRTIESRVTEVSPKVICPNVWYDENQPCDWIPNNLKPLDDLGRSVPSFTTSQEAWNWGEAQMYDTSSNWYMCGFTRMEGNTNDGTMFYYAYMKSCPND